MYTSDKPVDANVRYLKREMDKMDKNIWLQARSLAVGRGINITQWAAEAFKEKIEKDKNKEVEI